MKENNNLTENTASAAAIQLNSEYVEAFYTRGITKRYLKELKDAKKDLETALELVNHTFDFDLADKIAEALNNI